MHGAYKQKITSLCPGYRIIFRLSNTSFTKVCLVSRWFSHLLKTSNFAIWHRKLSHDIDPLSSGCQNGCVSGTFPNILIHSHFQTFLSIHISKQSYPFTFPNIPIHSHFQTFLSIHISKHSYPFTFPNILIHSHVFRQVLPDVLILRNEGCGTYQEQWQGLCDAQCMAAQQNLPCRDAHRVLQLQTNPNVECWLSVRCVEWESSSMSDWYY